MKTRNLLGKCLAGAFAALLVFPAHATLVNVTNVADLGGSNIPAPTNALDDLIGSNTLQLGFDELSVGAIEVGESTTRVRLDGRALIR